MAERPVGIQQRGFSAEQVDQANALPVPANHLGFVTREPELLSLVIGEVDVQLRVVIIEIDERVSGERRDDQV
jgi:hypothetical protein